LERFSPNPSMRRVSPSRHTYSGTKKARMPDLPRWSALAPPAIPIKRSHCMLPSPARNRQPLRLHDDLTSFHRLSVAAVQSEGQHLTLRHGSAPQAYSDYSHYYPTRADGKVGGLLQCISPSCCPRSWPLDQSATIGNLCTNPSRMRPLETPVAHRTPANATSGGGNPAHCRARFLPTSHPFRVIRHLPPSRSASNIHTSAVP
jgi:hypothetical protein